MGGPWNPKSKPVPVSFTRPQLRRILAMARAEAPKIDNLVDRRVIEALARKAREALERARAADREQLGSVG